MTIEAAHDEPIATPDAPHAPLLQRVELRSLSIAVLAVLATLFALHWAAAVFVPVLFGVVFSHALAPAVDWLQRRSIPRGVGAALVVGLIVASLAASAYALSDQAVTLIESLPQAAQKVRDTMREHRQKAKSPLARVQEAASQLEQAAHDGAPRGTAARGVTRVLVEKPRFDINDHLWSGTVGIATGIGQVTMVVFITYFLLVAGDFFRRKLVRITGPTLSRRKVTVQVLDEITAQIRRYLLVQAFVSVIVGLATTFVYWALGLQNAAVWGFVAGVSNLIPYLGAVFVTGASALVAFLQFGTLDMALAVGGAAMLLHAVTGYWLTPWLTSRASRLNAVVVFVGVLAFGWLWGIWGLLLGVPVLMMVKAVCDRVDELAPLGELLGS